MRTAMLIAALAFATGLTSKFADLLNEHGVSWFRGSSEVLGVVWGTLALLLTLSDRWVAVLWVSTVLYWFFRMKLDHFNHALAGVCVIIGGLVMAQNDGLSIIAVVVLTTWLCASGVVNTYLKERYRGRGALQLFLRLRLRYYVGPLLLAAYARSWTAVVAILAGMLGTELVAMWHAHLVSEAVPGSGWFSISYNPAADESVDNTSAVRPALIRGPRQQVSPSSVAGGTRA
jgi:hypothetical protein